MKITVINGTIKVLGDSSLNGDRRRYAYINFEGTDGKDVLAKTVVVFPEVDRALSVGCSGTFILATDFTGSGLAAARVNGEEVYARSLDKGGLKTAYIMAILFILFGLATAIIIVGFLFIAFGVYVLFAGPKRKKALLAAAREHGFKIPAKTIYI